MTHILLLGIVLIVIVAISGRRINSERKKVFFWKSYKMVLENKSLREEHILLTLFTNTTMNPEESNYFLPNLDLWSLNVKSKK